MFEAESYNDYKILLGKVEEFVESYNKKTELLDVNTGKKAWPARADLQLKEQNIENLEKAGKMISIEEQG